MFFLLKSVFWLWIVFSCMTWPGQQRPEAVAREAAGELAARAQAAAVEKASSACANTPRSCLDLAKRSASIVQAALPPVRPGRGRLGD